MKSSDQNWQQAVDALRAANEVAVFTGAGVSAESGIATFRDAGGFWKEFPPEQFANWKALTRMAITNPKRFGEFLLAILEPIATAAPNDGHRAIARLEEHVNVTVITQNIDGLHQAAGNTIVREIHGTLFEIVDLRTRRFRRLISRRELHEIVNSIRAVLSGRLVSARLMLAVQPLFGADLSGGHRPNLVMFGDAMAEPAWSESLDRARCCDVLLAVGTSGEVYPAAALPFEAQSSGATVITIDPTNSGTGIALIGTASEILPALIRDTFGETLE